MDCSSYKITPTSAFSCLEFWITCEEGNENPLWNLHILLVPIPVSYLSALTLPIPPSYMWSSVCVLLTEYRQPPTVLLAPADSDLLFESVRLTVQQLLGLFEVTMDWRGIEPMPGFSPGFRFKFANPGGNTGVPRFNRCFVLSNVERGFIWFSLKCHLKIVKWMTICFYNINIINLFPIFVYYNSKWNLFFLFTW